MSHDDVISVSQLKTEVKWYISVYFNVYLFTQCSLYSCWVVEWFV